MRASAGLLMQSETGWSAPPLSSMQELLIVKVIAGAFLSGEPTVPQIVARVSRTLGKRWRWLQPLARCYVKTIVGRTRPRRRDVVKLFCTTRVSRRPGRNISTNSRFAPTLVFFDI